MTNINAEPIFNIGSSCNLAVSASRKEVLELFLKRVIERVGVAKEVTIWMYRYNNLSVISFDVRNEAEWFSLNIQPIGETDLLPNGFLGDVYVQDWVDAHHLSRWLLQRLGFSYAKVDTSKNFLAFSKQE